MAEQSLCSIPGCDNPVLRRGWCNRHYLRWQRHGDPVGGGEARQKPGLCSVDGCERPRRNKGWCTMHFQRWKNTGSPGQANRLIAKDGEPLRFILDVAMEYEGNDCLIWPFGKSQGYGNLDYNGNRISASRLVCEMVNGPEPEPNMDAAHSCGNGHLACVNKGHLSWKTRAGNVADMIGHGTARRGTKNSLSKITEADALEIKRLKGQVTQDALSKRFGISQSQIWRIQNGERWSWLTK